MSSKFMKSAAVLGTATLASLLLVACGSKAADKVSETANKAAEKVADATSSGKELTLYVEDQYKAFAESAAKLTKKSWRKSYHQNRRPNGWA